MDCSTLTRRSQTINIQSPSSAMACDYSEAVNDHHRVRRQAAASPRTRCVTRLHDLAAGRCRTSAARLNNGQDPLQRASNACCCCVRLLSCPARVRLRAGGECGGVFGARGGLERRVRVARGVDWRFGHFCANRHVRVHGVLRVVVLRLRPMYLSVGMV